MRITDTLLDSEGRIDPVAWAAAAASRVPVGTCGECGASATGELPGGLGKWVTPTYSASCVACGDDVAIPVQRVVRKPPPSASEAVLAAGRERDAAILGEREDEE